MRLPVSVAWQKHVENKNLGAGKPVNRAGRLDDICLRRIGPEG
jgi:hypothetical protein